MNLAGIIDRAALNFPDKTALVFDRSRFSYERLKSASERVALYLRELGIRQGDRIAIFMPNRPEWVIAYYGIIRLGGVAVCASSAYKQMELAHLLNDSGAALLITCEELLSQVPEQESVPCVKDVVVWENNSVLASALKKRPSGHGLFRPVDCNFNDACAILFTGGTTGSPKGAMLTHGNILYSAQNVCYHERAVPDDVALCFLPLNHVFGGVHIMNSVFYGACTLVLHKNFDMDKVIASVQSEKITRFYSVPTVFIRLLNTTGSGKFLTSVNYCFSAATSMASEIVRRWWETFNMTIHEAYGMTETSSLVTFNHMYHHKIGSVGTPAGIVEVKIVDENINELPAGESGEIVIRGPNVMKGYFNREEETTGVLHNGWMRSGDIGRFDEDGYLYIVDRIKDLIISGGLNVYPREVEDILYTHEAARRFQLS